MKSRVVEAERRLASCWATFGAFSLALMFGAWWLVENTNKEGQHNAELLPFVALIPRGIGLYHLIRSRPHRA